MLAANEVILVAGIVVFVLIGDKLLSNRSFVEGRL